MKTYIFTYKYVIKDEKTDEVTNWGESTMEMRAESRSELNTQKAIEQIRKESANRLKKGEMLGYANYYKIELKGR